MADANLERTLEQMLRRVESLEREVERLRALPGASLGSGAWNGGHIVLGNHHLWMNTDGTLQIKNGAPGSAADGFAATSIRKQVGPVNAPSGNAVRIARISISGAAAWVGSFLVCVYGTAASRMFVNQFVLNYAWTSESLDQIGLPSVYGMTSPSVSITNFQNSRIDIALVQSSGVTVAVRTLIQELRIHSGTVTITT